MKIQNHSVHQAQQLDNGKARTEKTSNQNSFSQILDNVKGEKAQYSGDISSINMEGCCKIGEEIFLQDGIQETGPAEPISHDIREAALRSSEQLLNILDSLAAAIETGGVEKESLQQIAISLKEKLSQVQAAQEELPDKDPLRSILDEIGMLSQVEQMKILRGDYLT